MLELGVQNGADCIYFGANSFSARASAKNFSLEEVAEVVKYCTLRNVKTNLTLNTLITDDEFEDAIKVAESAYKCGVDAIIVQDLGLAKYLITHFPGMEIHGSTQMSVHNLEGVLELEKLGFSRVVLSREVPINEIEYIRNNCKVDLEIFVHGALCISYSGQCLFSSLVGGRSGNRGKCAQPCRLPYELLEDKNGTENVLDKGYLLSPRDLCSLDVLPTLVKLGINSFKIEGRMKTPEYVATVTRIYRKYIDLALSSNKYVVDEADKLELQQVFNRGGFSSGHLLSEPNRKLIFKDKPNNMGLYLGNISNYNANRGHITLKLNQPVGIGDTISIDGETGTYTISELIKGNTNLKTAEIGQIVKLGRMKGKIRVGAKVYKLSSKTLNDQVDRTFAPNCENKKIPVTCSVSVKKDKPISITLEANVAPFYNNVSVKFVSDIVPEISVNSPITETRIADQLNKLGNTPYTFEKLNINLDKNLHIPSISALNNARRTAINMLQEKIMDRFLENRKQNEINQNESIFCKDNSTTLDNTNSSTKSIAISVQNSITSSSMIKRSFENTNNVLQRKVSVLLENINLEYDYTQLENVDNIYIPLKFFLNKKYKTLLFNLSRKFDLYIYMPTIIKPNYKNLLLNNIDIIVSDYEIKGFVISNIAGFELLKKYINNKKYTFVANYTINIFNKYSIAELQSLGINVVTPSVELNKSILQELCSNSPLPVELIAYGRNVLMNSSYCLLGKSNKCYPKCDMKCKNCASSTNLMNNSDTSNADKSYTTKYYIKDRLGFKFRIIPDNIQTVTSIYNSKITSIDTHDFKISAVRINILDESIEEINNIVTSVKNGNKLEGKEYTNGNLNREI